MSIQQALDVLNVALNLRKNKNMWTLNSERDEVRLYQQDCPDVCNLPCYMIESLYSLSKDDMVDKIWLMNEEKAKESDAKITMWREIEKGDNYRICEQYTSMNWPLYPRHLIYAQYKIDRDDNTYLVSFTIKHPTVKVNEKTHVESICHLSVYGYEKVNDKHLNVWRILQVDPQGNITTSLISYYSKTFMDRFVEWKQ